MSNILYMCKIISHKSNIYSMFYKCITIYYTFSFILDQPFRFGKCKKLTYTMFLYWSTSFLEKRKKFNLWNKKTLNTIAGYMDSITY